MVLRPVKFNPTRNPWTGKPYQSRLHHLIVIHKMALFHFIISHVYTSTQFRQYHNLDILILYKKSMILLINFIIGYFFYYRIRVYRATTTLIYSLLQENGILLFLSYFIGRKQNIFFPGTYLTGMYRTLN